MVLAKTSGRGFRRNVRGLADAEIELAEPLPRVAGDEEAPAGEPIRAGAVRPGAAAEARTARHHGGPDENDRGRIRGSVRRPVPRHVRGGAGSSARGHLSQARRRAPRVARRLGDRRGAPGRAHQHHRDLDRRAARRGARPGGLDRGRDPKAGLPRRPGKREGLPGASDGVHDDARGELSHAGEIPQSVEVVLDSESLRIGVLYDEWIETKEAPAEPAPGDVPKRKRRQDKPDREEIFEALTKKGHKPEYFCLDGRPKTLKALASAEVDLMFNLTESYGGD